MSDVVTAKDKDGNVHWTTRDSALIRDGILTLDEEDADAQTDAAPSGDDPDAERADSEPGDGTPGVDGPRRQRRASAPEPESGS